MDYPGPEQLELFTDMSQWPWAGLAPRGLTKVRDLFSFDARARAGEPGRRSGEVIKAPRPAGRGVFLQLELFDGTST